MRYLPHKFRSHGTFFPDCNPNADIVFVLDESGSVGADDFDKSKNFIKVLIENIDIGKLQSRVAVVTFDLTAKVAFHLDDYDNKTLIKSRIDEIPYGGGGTDIASGLRMIRENLFVPDHGDREEQRNIAVLFTDGRSGNTGEESQLTRDAGVVLIAVGIGSGINMTQLKEIATDPDELHVFSVDSFDLMASIHANLQMAMCNRKCH